jgi:hypothetical protein
MEIPRWLRERSLIVLSTLEDRIDLAIYGPYCPDTSLFAQISGRRLHTDEEFSTSFHFGRATHPDYIEPRWNLPDSTLGIFLNGECWLLYRYGPYRRRSREYWRLPPQPPFSAAEINYICAKEREQFRKVK